MALSFPQNPATGTVYTAPNGTSYTYDGVRWRVGTAARTIVKEVSYNVDAGHSRTLLAVEQATGSGNATRINASTGSVSYSYISMTATPTSSMSLDFDGDEDDGFISDITVPFTITFLGTSYTSSQVWISSNSYIAFGDDQEWGYAPYYNDGDDEINIEASFDIPSLGFVFDPAQMDSGTLGLPFLAVSSYDNSVQQIHTLTTGTAGSRTFILRWTGNGDYSNATSHPIVWEVRFYEDQPGIIDLLIIADSRGDNGGANGVSDNSQWLGGRNPKLAFPLGIGNYQYNVVSGIVESLWDGGTSQVTGTAYDLNLDGGSSNSRYLITDLDGGGA
jgi:hypothetical protein